MGSRGLEVSDVTCEGGPCQASTQCGSTVLACLGHHSLTCPASQPCHSGVLFPSCYSPPASVPKERLQRGHRHPRPIPLASRWAGRQVRAVCSPQTSPDRRLLVGPWSEPCRSSRPTTSCFQTIPQPGSPGLKGEVCPLLSWKPGWQSAQRKNTVSIKSNAVTFQTSGSETGNGMVGGGRASPEQKWAPNPNHWI